MNNVAIYHLKSWTVSPTMITMYQKNTKKPYDSCGVWGGVHVNLVHNHQTRRGYVGFSFAWKQ